MKTLFFTLLFSGSLMAATGVAKATEIVTTSSVSAEKAQPVAKLLGAASGLVGKTVVVTGMVDHVCSHSGRRCFIADDKEDLSIRVEAKGEIKGFNKELVGSTIEVTGILREQKLPKAKIEEMEAAARKKNDGDHCSTELNNVLNMKKWMKDNQKDYYSIYYIDGSSYEVRD